MKVARSVAAFRSRASAPSHRSTQHTTLALECIDRCRLSTPAVWAAAVTRRVTICADKGTTRSPDSGLDPPTLHTVCERRPS